VSRPCAFNVWLSENDPRHKNSVCCREDGKRNEKPKRHLYPIRLRQDHHLDPVLVHFARAQTTAFRCY